MYAIAHRCSHASAGAHPISFCCQGLSYGSWWQRASRLTASPGTRASVFACLCAHEHLLRICVPPMQGVRVLNISSSPSPIKRRNGTSLIASTKDTWVRRPLSCTLISVTALFAASPFNCLSLTRAHGHSGRLRYCASSSLPLKWNDLISQLSILKDIYKTH